MLLFYDIEVTKWDALVVFLDIDGNEVKHFWSDRGRASLQMEGMPVQDPDVVTGFEGLESIVQDNILVGYNNYHYDDVVLSAMLNSYTNSAKQLKATNDLIIKGGTKEINPIIRSIDTMQQASVQRPSLKQIEGNMGRSIIESDVDFNIDRPLTDEERQTMLEYCRYDVLSTIEVYKLREKSYFETKDYLVSMLPEGSSDRAYRWNTTTLSASILTANASISEKKKHCVPERYWRNVPGIPDEVWEMWESANEATANGEKIKGKSKTVEAYGCKFVFGLGGLHGAPKKPGVYTNIKLADVGSMYPSIITELRILDGATDLYDSMRLERLKIKKTDPVRANALKLILNSVYGNLKNKYSSLNNPLMSNSVCIYGEIALFKLCTMLHEAGYQIINANTDGVAYVDKPGCDLAQRIYRQWEAEFGLSLDEDVFTTWYQRDVNNYIALTPKGKIKTKGGDTNKAFDNKFFDNNSARIIQIALVNNIVNGDSWHTTLKKYKDDPLLWQYILKAGGTFDGVVDQDGAFQQKVNRVFAAKEGIKLYKLRKDGTPVNFPDVPEKMFLYNGDLKDLPSDWFKKIDAAHYERMYKSKREAWPQCT